MAKNMKTPRIAIVHDWLVDSGGAEKVLAAMLLHWPHAPVYTLVHDSQGPTATFLKGHKVYTSFLQKLPQATRRYRSFLPLAPIAIEQFDLSEFDLVISNSYAVAKGVLTGPDQLHICMCCSPIRYAWDLQHQYLRESGLDKGFTGLLARIVLHYIRIWDARTANGVDKFIAISEFIARRIKKVYGRESTIIYPPVDIDSFCLSEKKEDFYLTASRMVTYKRIDLIVEAFSKMPDKQLVVIGDGPDFRKIQLRAKSNVVLLGYQPIEVLIDYMQRAKAFVFAAEEDFGIIPIESQACGTPVIAYGKGGAIETVQDGKTGIFFEEQTPESLIAAVQKFEQMSPFDTHAMRENAKHFSEQRFYSEFKEYVMNAWQEHFEKDYRNPFS